MSDLVKLLIVGLVLFGLQLLFIRKMLGISRVIHALNGIDDSLKQLPCVKERDRQLRKAS